jgi:hypothetical protein
MCETPSHPSQIGAIVPETSSKSTTWGNWIKSFDSTDGINPENAGTFAARIA